MGGACSSSTKVHSQQPIKMILLGCPAVGKSTVFKQLTLIYKQETFNTEMKKSFCQPILDALVSTQLLVFSVAKKMGKEFKDEGFPGVMEKLEAASLILKRNIEKEDLGDESFQAINVEDILNHVNQVAKDEMMKEVLKQMTDPVGGELYEDYFDQLPESAMYFLERLPEMINEDVYIPTNDDILRLRRTTLEATSVSFNKEMEWPPRSGNKALVPVVCTDVGGQSHHEYDWVTHGSDSTAVLYVMCLSDFDVETSEGNKLKQSLNLLRKLSRSPVFLGKQFVILLNKSDLLEEKLKHRKLRNYFSSFMGENTVEDVTEFFEDRCTEIIESARAEVEEYSTDVQISVVETCAINSKLMHDVLTSVLFGLFQATIRKVWN